MDTITNENVRNYNVNGSWTINGSMKPDKDSEDSKTFTLNVRFNNVPVIDIINKSLDPTKIQWVNGPGRSKFDTWTKGQTINIDFKSPGRVPQMTAKEQFKADAIAAGVDLTDRKAALEFYEEWINE